MMPSRSKATVVTVCLLSVGIPEYPVALLSALESLYYPIFMVFCLQSLLSVCYLLLSFGSYPPSIFLIRPTSAPLQPSCSINGMSLFNFYSYESFHHHL